ncbi:MAG TPA: hypothetical protein VGV39_07485 [Mesorhizobium sp.]|jgi:hypothetical protein|uniref:hypothetical protein n=1 Tax=Mesorhizobium sp. TaxID=1871066 RepID=UPI002DDD8542|nr:hypothetical protein [Mesorhizobium sp.]HEV2502901.1 hypothetical protein [Mesorhizobium sp.]
MPNHFDACMSQLEARSARETGSSHSSGDENGDQRHGKDELKSGREFFAEKDRARAAPKHHA